MNTLLRKIQRLRERIPEQTALNTDWQDDQDARAEFFALGLVVGRADELRERMAAGEIVISEDREFLKATDARGAAWKAKNWGK